MPTYRFVLTGLGNVGRNFLEILLNTRALLHHRYGFTLLPVGVADSSGAVAAPEGLDIAAVVALKRNRHGVVELAQPGQRYADGLALLQAVEAEFLLEATPTNLAHGQPGLDLTRAALRRGMHAILGSKGPLVLAYQELVGLSDLAVPSQRAGRPALRFSGAVGGALPTINLGRRDLAGGSIRRVEAILNGTTQIVLGLMDQGASYAAALAEAQRVGMAEPDPSLDVEGWDAANKLVILANAVLDCPATLADVAVTGIMGVTLAELQAARAAGGRVSLLAVAEALPVGSVPLPYRLSVAPTVLSAGHPLARLDLDEMAVVYETDIYGRVMTTCAGQGPAGAAAAMLRDVIEVVRTTTEREAPLWDHRQRTSED